MKLKSSRLGRVAGGCLAMLFVGGCITHPPGGASRREGGGIVHEVNGTSYWDLSTFEGADDLSDKSYYYWRTTTTADGSVYEESGYYLYITHPPGGANDVQCVWKYPSQDGVLARRFGKAGSYGKYGWYAQITHPPGGGYVVCGTNTVITHQPGGKPADVSK